MKARHIAAVSALALLAGASAQAQTVPASIGEAVFVTCKEAHAMQVEPRQRLALFIADHVARFRGVMIPEDERGAQLALLVRGGCTLSPDAYLFTVIDRAILAEKDKLPKRQ
jgi:hypothetical protein